MKTLVFKNIKYKNLMSVGNSFISVSLDQYKNTLITGKNGSAKSTILEAIFYSLFDQPFRRIKMGQLINSSNNKQLEVQLELTNGDDHVVITRGQKPSIFEVLINNEKMDESGSKKDTQDRLEKYLGINPISFRQVVVLGTAGYKPFMELTTPERRKLVEDILDLSSIAQMDKLNKDVLRNINQDLNLSTIKITALEDKKQSLLKINETQQKNLEEANNRIKAQVDQLKTSAEVIKDQLASKKAEHDSIELKDFDLDQFRTQRDKIKETISSLKYQTSDLIKKIRLHKSGKCPTCEGDLDQSHVEDLEPQVLSNNQKKEKLATALQNIETSYNSFIKDKQVKDTTKAELDKLIQRYKEIMTKIEYLESSVQSMPESIDTTEDINKTEQEIKTLDKQKRDLTMEKYNRGIMTDLLKDSGVKAKVVEYYVPYLNQRINYYLGLLEADYNFTLDSEFNEQIKSVGRENFSYFSFSEGEKARIDISMLFSWKDVASKISGTSINILLLDELFDGSTDSDGKEGMMNILDNLEGNTFVISHAEQDPQSYERHIQMTKVGRFSQKTETINVK